MERRSLLRALGASAIVPLAGCADGDDGAGTDDRDGGMDDSEEATDDGDDGVAEDDGDEATEDDDGVADDGEDETDAEDGEEAEDGEDATEDDEEAEDGESVSGEDYPAVDEWLTEDDVGGPAPNYDGSIEDHRGSDEVEVAVGGGDDGLTFEPAAVVVSPGTTVLWEWTGEGGVHNVVAAPDEQIGESDYEFSSGDPVDAEGETYEETFDEAGTALYQCEPHLTIGMKGAVAVDEE